MPPTKKPFNFVELSPEELRRGQRLYYCLAKVKELRLRNVTGYFITADDLIFHVWTEIDLSTTFHPLGIKNVSPPFLKKDVMNYIVEDSGYSTSDLSHRKAVQFLWHRDRVDWTKWYHKDLVLLHPIKPSTLVDVRNRHRFCSAVVRTFKEVLLQ
ncbi:unnamed protein product [Nippostrongylus brasiliensis]|uniref:PMD domain-containing protein n=1 Tax=Nippostrongylus brasiliensis TaxID=27835 RepID=A0A0N4XT68_NIPBR|nr:unnamed protein product [Nippostrongylus brasiliensis]